MGSTRKIPQAPMVRQAAGSAPPPAATWPFPVSAHVERASGPADLLTVADLPAGETPAVSESPSADRLLPRHSDSDVADVLIAEVSRLETRIEVMERRKTDRVGISVGFARSLVMAMTAAAQRLEARSENPPGERPTNPQNSPT